MHKLTYYRRIQLSFLLFIILPILAVSVFSYTLLKQNMIEKFQLSNSSMLNVIAGEIERTIDDVTFASHYIVNDTGLRASLDNFADTARINTYTDYTRFMKIKDSFSLITSKPLNNSIRMYLVNRAGFVISPDSENLKAMSGRLDQLLAKVDPSRPAVLQWLGLLKDEADGKGTYYIARVIGGGASQPYTSVLLIAIRTSYFEQLLNRVEFGSPALFDGSGVPIAGSPDMALQPEKTPDAKLRLETVLDKTDWTLVYETSEEALTGQISRAFYTGIGLVLLFTLLFSIISLFFAKRLHSPIRKLQRVARQFTMGNRDMRLDIVGKDDIAELGSSFNLMLDEIEVLIANIEQEQEQKRVIELEALFMQIRPHFLINTLNSIKCSLILNDDQLHSSVIDSLMGLLRAYLKVSESSTLEEECRLLGYYADIMNVRNEMELQLEFGLTPDLEKFAVPKLVLQPLVENAIVHGLVDRENPRIALSASREQGIVTIIIADNGWGMEEELLVALNRQLNDPESEEYAAYRRVGLRNVIQRLRLTFGPGAAMELCTNAQGGISAVLSIPVPER
ncbi:helicase Ski2 [Paenibacillus sp. FSL R7-0273]|uniref:sensor histidine kinase n=1 Tax=Paenibacillus sp. FSL R7-0273 TaxID=1536772 RepID=UPI0004F6B8C5|nr:histidine kinase [Paenibacillus sp. FSL R7-0273]AIQ48933.1 helicase Ski2 [Paenibacillus sp. FSL R7-0273]OMF91189.1 helicase Ski2 [Paenibacillus sp. FSL R7-0273]